MARNDGQAGNSGPDSAWQRYGDALVQAMEEVLAQAADEERSVLLETADYWLSIGLAIGTGDPQAAEQLLRVIEAEEPERAELADDAAHFVAEALE